MSVLFQGREFTAHDVHQTSIAVVGYAVGLIGLIAVKILAPGFYAQKDIRTPVKIAVAVLIATQIANLVLVPLFAHAGLALSVSLGACANALALFVGLKRRGVYAPQAGWGRFLVDSWWPCWFSPGRCGGYGSRSTGRYCSHHRCSELVCSEASSLRRPRCTSLRCSRSDFARATFGTGGVRDLRRR